MRTEGFGGFIRPTAAERAAGRLMRAPDHDAGSADAGATGDASDAGASGNADVGTTGAAAVDTSGQADDATLLGSATTEGGTGDAEGKDSQAAPTPTPVDDDAGVPEAYELKLTKTADDGTETVIEMDPALVETATPVLKELGLSNEKASKLVELVPQIQERVIAQMNDSFAATRADWAKQTKEDPEIGGKNFAETVRLAGKALDHFGAPSAIVDGKETNEFRQLLNDSGLGNHPVMMRMFRDIGAAASEDGTLTRNTTIVETKKSREETLYPDDVPKTS